jgi:hypothetical protein
MPTNGDELVIAQCHVDQAQACVDEQVRRIEEARALGFSAQDEEANLADMVRLLKTMERYRDEIRAKIPDSQLREKAVPPPDRHADLQRAAQLRAQSAEAREVAILIDRTDLRVRILGAAEAWNRKAAELELKWLAKKVGD